MTTHAPGPTVPAAKPPRKKARKPVNQHSGHELFLLMCQNIGGDPTAKKTLRVNARDIKGAFRMRSEFYSWRKAIITQLGEEFALDNKVGDVRIRIEPQLDPITGEVMRDAKGHPLPTHEVTFYSLRNTNETKALVEAFGQLGLELGGGL